MNLLADIFGDNGYIQWYQLILIALLIALIVFYVQMKKKGKL